ncbi:MAG: NUDIX hydrolase [Candidatus Omnitrophica bacterium]|nr:NUDIX hydrolase [Candidatus Omnitrophota bacterium]MBU4488145.1 NUDIX hydrolase [Candidatus Omnitrophota bacterium]MCG2704532.1 NUDIX hydrolase [Candidatus Omnitrophota bacterium]
MAKTERERSSGGIIVKFERGTIKILLIKDPYGKWTWPKGKIDKGETSLEAARREIREEVGLKEIEFLRKAGKTDYFYKRDGKLIYKTVYLYLFKLTGDDKLVIQKREIADGKWFSIDKAFSMLGYGGAKGIMRRALRKRREI